MQDNMYSHQTYNTYLATADKTQIPAKMAEQAKLINVKVKADDIKVPEKWPEIEQFLADKKDIEDQYATAKKAVQLPMVHPVMRATLMALEGAGIINDSNQGALFETVRKMVEEDIAIELTRLEKGLRDDKFKRLYGEEVQRRVLIERAHKRYNELTAKAELTEDEHLLLSECECVILLDGDLTPLNQIHDEPKK